MATVWTEQELTLLKALRATCTIGEIHQVFQQLGIERSPEGIRKKASKLDLQHETIGSPDTKKLAFVEQRAVEAVLNSRLTELTDPSPPLIHTPGERSSRSQKALRVTSNMREILEEIWQDKMLGIPKRPDKPVKSKKASLVLLLSDMHFGKKIHSPEGDISFNTKIAKDRLLSTSDRILDLLPTSMKEFDELVILLLGDCIDGEGIYKGQHENVEIYSLEQWSATTETLWHVIKRLGEDFPRVRIATVPGNHGRTDGVYTTNIDNFIYRALEMLIREHGESHISILNKYEKFNTIIVKGQKGLLRHRAPSQYETAAGRSRLGGWFKIHELDFLTYGHLHHIGMGSWNGIPTFMNGSLCGGDDYGEEFGSADAPAQLMFAVTDEHVPLFLIPITYI